MLPAQSPPPRQPQIGVLLLELAHAFPRQPLPPETHAIYARELGDIPEPVLAVSIRQLMRTSEWVPTIRGIRETAAEHVLALPTEAQALAQIEARLVWAAQGAEGDAPDVHDLAAEALAHVGGYSAFKSIETYRARNAFLRAYRDLRQERIHAYIVRPPEAA